MAIVGERNIAVKKWDMNKPEFISLASNWNFLFVFFIYWHWKSDKNDEIKNTVNKKKYCCKIEDAKKTMIHVEKQQIFKFMCDKKLMKVP